MMELTIPSHSIPAAQLEINVLTMDSATIHTIHLWAPARPAVSLNSQTCPNIHWHRADYVGGCNDAPLADPSCNPGCDQPAYQDVTFNRTIQQWFCCGANGSNIKCNNPTTVTVSAKAITSIATTYVVPNQARLKYAIPRIDTVSLQNRYRIVVSILVLIQTSLQGPSVPKITLTKNHIKSRTLDKYYIN